MLLIIVTIIDKSKKKKNEVGLLSPKILISRLVKVWNGGVRKQCRDSNIFELWVVSLNKYNYIIQQLQ